MIFRFLKKITAPTLFSKGLDQYRQGQYGIARQLFNKAEQWMPTLASDSLYQAVTLLCDHHLNSDTNTHQAQILLNELIASSQQDTPQYAGVISDLKNIIDTELPNDAP